MASRRCVLWALWALMAAVAAAGCEADGPSRQPEPAQAAGAGAGAAETASQRAVPAVDHADYGPVPVTGAGAGASQAQQSSGGGTGVDVAGAAHVTPRDVDLPPGWARRQVGGQPVVMAGQGQDPLTVELTGLEPSQRYHVMVGYVLGLAGGVTDGWGLRARLAGAGGDFVRFDQGSARYQPDPANPWVFEAAVGQAAPDGEGRLAVEVDALDAAGEQAHSALAYVRAATSPPLDRSGAELDVGLAQGRPPQVPASGAAEFPAAEDYMTLLQRWPAHAEEGFTEGYRGDGRLGYFGSGVSRESGMRSLGNFIYAYALLSGDERYDPQVSGVSAAELERHARMALRYMARTHRTGDLPATDGETWGSQWQSSWWTSRFAGGAFLLWDRLSQHERSLVTRVVTAEANRQLSRSPRSAVDGDSRAEENAWDTEVLAWAEALMPDHPNADAWREALNGWAMNSLSTRGDATDQRVIAGRSVAAWNHTRNVSDDFSIQNHGAYHAGYMAWPLQSLTWSYYALAAADRPVPSTLLHNYEQVWQRLASTYLGQGRFAYFGGKDWPQYLYGMYAIVPPTVLLQHVGDDGVASRVETDRLRLLEWEQRLWSDGSFFGGRLAGRPYAGWNSVFDSDAAALLGMAYHLDTVLGGSGDGDDASDRAAGGDSDRPQAQPVEGGAGGPQLAARVASSASDFVMARGGGLTTAFSWKTLGCCFNAVSEQGDVLGMVSAGDPHMLAWQEGQLAGGFSLAGVDEAPLGVAWNDTREMADGGYATLGVRWVGGSAARPALAQQLAMVSLPQLDRAVVLDQPVAVRPVELTDSFGLDLHVTNDIFNQLTRRVVSGGQEQVVASGQADRDIELSAPWANVDGRLGVAVDGSAGALRLRTRAVRTEPWGGLRAERLQWQPAEPGGSYAPGAVIRRLAVGFHAGGAEQTGQLSQGLQALDTGDAQVSAAVVGGERPGDETVLVAANFADQPRRLDVAGDATPMFERTVELPPRSVRIVTSREEQARLAQ